MAPSGMVLKRFLNLARSSGGRPSIPEGQRVYAVGDVHGRLDLLDILLEKIAEDDARRGSSDTEIIFLGDLIDRGPASAGVVERLRTLSESDRRFRFLSGNHEEVFLKTLSGDLKAMKLLIRIGGKETIFSYGVTPDEYAACDFDELLCLMRSNIQQQHLEFIGSFEEYIETGDYIFVHAGVRPGVPIEDQRTSDLRWIRNEFLASKADFGGVVVHGHNVTAEIDRRANRIGIDTGAYATGRLTALGLEGEAQWEIVAEMADVVVNA